MANPVTHWQILTKQPEKLEAFYSELFGWKISGDNPLGYRTVETNAETGIGGGLWPIGANEGQSGVQLFIRVEDLNLYVENAQKLGARVVIPPQTLPGGDEMAVLIDPDGISFGMFKSSAE